MMFSDLDEKLKYFSEKFNRTSIRPYIKEDIDTLNLDHELTFNQTLLCLDILTTGFHQNKDLLYREGIFDRESTELSSRLLANLTFINRLKPGSKKNDSALNRYFHPENVAVYWQNAESIINKVQANYNDYWIPLKLLTLAECFRDIVSRMPDWNPTYLGSTIKISERVGMHNQSVIILTDNPAFAITALHDDKIRPLFSEYNQKESAETAVKKYYGTDGAYAAHYRNLLDCKTRYPIQKHLLQQ